MRGTDSAKSRKIIPPKSAPAPAPTPRAAVALKPFPIVGLGASAGGLEALEKFLSHLPPDCGLGFVVVTHQHPGHTSLLPELLGKCTRMRVKLAADGTVVEPNTVYLSLPEGYLAILHGTLHIMEPDETGLLRLPIDYFFRSLADDQKEKAIGIVLSGTGTDGTLGLKAIKGATGMTMAQEPDSARYSGMPSSAIATGLVDYVLLDHEAIDTARVGLYPEGIARDVRPQRLARFFNQEDGGYRIKKEIREMVVFAPQNVLERSAVHQAGPHCLPQPPHLCETRRAGTAALAVPLRAEGGRHSVPRHLGEHHRSQ